MKLVTATSLTCALILAVVAPGAGLRAQADVPMSSIVGSWTLNPALSDSIPERMPGAGRGAGAGQGGFGQGGRHGGGGFGGGSGLPGTGFPSGGGGAQRDPEEAMRRQEAMRAILGAPNHLTIVRTDSMVIVTTGEGSTTRLSPDGQAIKDESTHSERRTRWDSGKLISVISGSGPRMTETYSADAGHRELLVTVQVEATGRDEPARIFHRIYQSDAR